MCTGMGYYSVFQRERAYLCLYVYSYGGAYPLIDIQNDRLLKY